MSVAAAPVEERGEVPVVQPGLTITAENIDLAGPGIPDVDYKLLAGSFNLVSRLALFPRPGLCGVRGLAEPRWQRGRRYSRCSGSCCAAKNCPPGRASRASPVFLTWHGIPPWILIRAIT